MGNYLIDPWEFQLLDNRRSCRGIASRTGTVGGIALCRVAAAGLTLSDIPPANAAPMLGWMIGFTICLGLI